MEITFGLAEIEETAKQVFNEIKNHKKIGFIGNLGTGKTTFIKHLCQILTTEDEITSPTYAIINNYKCKNGFINHIDLYRLNTIEEALNIGIEDYLFDNDYCFIEWPQLIEDILPENFIYIYFEEIEKSKRKIKIGINKS